MINITKSQPAPLCLSTEKEKANGDYKCGEVLKRITKDFHNKCYIVPCIKCQTGCCSSAEVADIC